MNFSLSQIQSILADTNPKTTEKLAQEAAQITRQFFGRTIALYTPLYISNYCDSSCQYCGFNQTNFIRRTKLTSQQIHSEMQQISQMGIKHVLILTGESPRMSPLPFILEAIKIAKGYFSNISLEIYPLNKEEYHEAYLTGADGITLYQETYNLKIYRQVHPSGQKQNFNFRRTAPQRIAAAGFRHIALGILLGLAPLAEDLFALFEHLAWMEKNFPGVEYSLSFPRLRQVPGIHFNPIAVSDSTFIKILCLSRILFPRVGINLSTRENPTLRDHALELGVTKISAGSKTTVGGYAGSKTTDQTPQFRIEDNRSIPEIIALLKNKNFDPIFTDWRSINNACF